jgi:Spy/CpxP family protein refolding chaperone
MASELCNASVALSNLAGGWRSSARDFPAEFEARRELIEAITSDQFDQTSNKEAQLVSIFAKHIPSRTAEP